MIKFFFFYSVGYNILYTLTFMLINFVLVYFVVPLSFVGVWLCEPWLPLGPPLHHIYKFILHLYIRLHQIIIMHFCIALHQTWFTRWHGEREKTIYMFEKELSRSFMDLQVHILIHLEDENQLATMVSCHWMFLLDMYTKKLKGFDRKREKN